MKSEVVDAIEHYDSNVPPFIEEELERLYGGRYACVEYFRIYHDMQGVGAYRVTRAGKPKTILLYQQQRDKLWVLNQAISIDAAELRHFAAHMFAAYPRVRRIDFHSIATDATDISYPHQCLMTREDTIASLPSTVDAYVASLGKSTRHNLRRYRERLTRDHPAFSFQVVPRTGIRFEHLRTLQRLNRDRLDDKGRLSTIDEAEFRRLSQLSARYGLVTLARIGDKIVGGMLCFVIGDGITFRIIAHDSAYDDYSLGFLIYFMTICEAINQGCRQMNFGWDYYPYKIRLGGQRRRLAMLSLYRSRYAYALDAAGLLRRRIAQVRQQIIAKLRDADESGHPGARTLFALAADVRRLLLRNTAQP